MDKQEHDTAGGHDTSAAADVMPPDVRPPTDNEKRWIDLLWRIMPLADVAERTGIAYPTLIYWQSRGYITPIVHWVADVHPASSEEKQRHAKHLLASGLDVRTVARYMQVSPCTIYQYKNA